ncbi:MAG: carboxypeptidase-like regulatory domain-containing protein, partial [Gemmatimonadales bacterium]
MRALLRSVLGFGCLLLLASPLVAQTSAAGRVRGRVVERGSGRALAGVEIGVSGQAVAATSDEDGRWMLPRLPAGDHTLRTRRIGYAPASLLVSVAPGDTAEVEIRLMPSALPLDEIVVTAARREQRLADVTVPTEIVTRESIEATGASNLAAALTEQTGIQ